MKSKANGWLVVIAAVAIAAALFIPLPIPHVSLPRLEKLKPSAFVSVLAWFLAVAGFWGLTRVALSTSGHKNQCPISISGKGVLSCITLSSITVLGCATIVFLPL